MRESAVRIGHVYPSLLGTYGDAGNARVLERRLAWRGFSVEIIDIEPDAPIPSSLDLYVLGGGEDLGQRLASSLLVQSAASIRLAHEHGAVVFGVCAGFQLLCDRYEPAEGEPVPGLGLIDAITVAGSPRCVGEIVVRTADRSLLTGFENHSGRTKLGATTRALGETLKGYGNGDGVDGAIGDRILATYMHGPALVRNPKLSDLMLSWVVGELAPIDDSIVNELRRARLSKAGFHRD
ncbi:MAG: type 1 glutamine amidotransferase [Actinomycetota bacterium]